MLSSTNVESLNNVWAKAKTVDLVLIQNGLQLSLINVECNLKWEEQGVFVI